MPDQCRRLVFQFKGMVFKPDDHVTCVVFNSSDAFESGQNKIQVDVLPNSTVKELIELVANQYGCKVDTIELTLQKNNITLTDKTDGLLSEFGFNVEPGSRNCLLLTERNKIQSPMLRASPAAVEDDLSLGASASPTGCISASGGDFYVATPPLPPPISSNSHTSEFTYNSSLIKQDTGYVGLVNQAMTCYLNSLIQALYMTPEFRNALYKWQYDSCNHDPNRLSMPYELQKLFLNLQTSSRTAVETTELTQSFGWDSSEVWQQHDIQELCRVMFDALERVLKDTQQADLIDNLYQGKMIDYVKCLDCGLEKTREDTFLDIPLPLRPFGSTEAYGSVEEAMRAFVQPETLEGNNQYHCDNCEKKCDAHKGLKFSKFPYLLTLHLKRFDFDYNTMHRIKLNDKVVFPEVLDLNSFIPQEKEEGSEGFPEELASSGKCDDSSTTDSGSALDDESCQGASEISQANDNVQEDDEGIDVSGSSSSGGNHHHNSENEKNRQHTLSKGPYLYELFSIMIHSGSASGGHYYAYIKDFANGEWFCFNDQTVNRITNDDITKTYGGGMMRGYYSAAYSSSTNAYMLMYRQIDKERNCEAITVDKFPPHIKELHKKLQEKEETDRKMKEKEMEMCRIKLYCQPPDQKTLIEAKMYCTNDTPLKEATEQAWRHLNLVEVVPLEQCRLVNYNRVQEMIECSFEGREDEPIVNVLSRLRNDLMLEIRQKNEKFITYQPGGMLTKVYLVDLDSEEVEDPVIVRGDVTQTLGQLKELIGQALHLDPTTLTVILEKYGNKLLHLTDDSQQVKYATQELSNKVFVCDGPCDPDPERPFISSKMDRIIDRFDNTVTFHISLPDTDPEVLNQLSIPPLPASSTTSNHSVVNGKQGDHSGCTNSDKGGGGGSADSGAYGGSRGGLSLPLLVSSGGNVASNTGTSTSVTSTSAGGQPVTVTSISAPATASGGAVLSSSSSVTVTGELEETGSQGAGGGDQSTSEDSSLTDSDRTLIGDEPEDYPLYNTEDISTEMLGTNNSEDYKLSTPPESGSNQALPNTEDEDGESSWFASESTRIKPNRFSYFKASPYTNDLGVKMLKVQVDKRMLLGILKTCLEPYVGVPSVYFKVYRMFPGHQESECTRLKESLSVFKDHEVLTIVLGRALRGGEHRVKVYQLVLDSTPTKQLCEWIIAKGQTVAQTKQEILNELSRKHNIKIPFNRCRLRKKNWKIPMKAYLDNQVWEDDIPILTNTDIFLQELPGSEIVTCTSQMLLFLRRWSPSKFRLGSFQEIVMNGRSVIELKTKISKESEIPVENVEFVRAPSSFPSDVSVLSIQDLDWNPIVDLIDRWPLHITDDGCVLFYRDNREVPKNLTTEEKKELTNKENARLNGPLSSPSPYSPRKERPLKIYLDTSPRRPQAVLDQEID